MDKEIKRFDRVELLPFKGIVQNYIWNGEGVRVTIDIGRKYKCWITVPLEAIKLVEN